MKQTFLTAVVTGVASLNCYFSQPNPEKSYTDLAEHEAQWVRDGWKILSLSGPLPQADGTVHRKAQLSRGKGEPGPGVSYEDRKIAKIKLGETTEAEMLERFGSPCNRDAKTDGTTHLAWRFAPRDESGSGQPGELHASLASDGKVNSYSARRGTE